VYVKEIHFNKFAFTINIRYFFSVLFGMLNRSLTLYEYIYIYIYVLHIVLILNTQHDRFFPRPLPGGHHEKDTLKSTKEYVAREKIMH
jgi:hypothetical protein